MLRRPYCSYQERVSLCTNLEDMDSWKGSMKLSMIDQFFLLGLYNDEPSRPLYSYVTELYKFLGTKVSTNTISKWFNYSFDFKASCRKTSIIPAQKISSMNIRKKKSK